MTAPDRSLPVPADTPPPGPGSRQDHRPPVPSGTADDLLPCATCPHLGVQHDIGTRRGVRVRTACSTSSGPQGVPCPCKTFTPRKES